MKIDTNKILLVVLIVLMLWGNFFKKGETPQVEPIRIEIPERVGTTGTQVVKEYVPYPVYLPNSNQRFDVDAEWKKKYEEANDSVDKYKQYLEAIRINKYEEKLVDNDTIEITGRATTRGSLLDYTVDYKIKPSFISYEPKTLTQLPKLSIGLGVEAGVPTFPNIPFTMKGNFSVQNKRGQEINLSYDTNQTIWLGLKKHFKIIK